jgi:hypothetical protein
MPRSRSHSQGLSRLARVSALVAFEFEWAHVLFPVPGLFLIGLGAWSFVLNPANRLNRAFALFMFLEGMQVVLRIVAGSVLEFPSTFRTYFFLAIPFAALNLGYAFLLQNRGLDARRWAWVPWLLLAGAIVCTGLYAYDHDYSAYQAGPDRAESGPLELVSSSHFLVLALLSVVFMLAHVGQTAQRPHRTFFLASLAFALIPAYFGLFYVFQQIAAAAEGTLEAYFYRTPLTGFITIETSLAPVVVLFALISLLRASNAQDRFNDQTRLFGQILLVIFVVALIGGVLAQTDLIPSPFAPHFVILGLLYVAFATLLSTLVRRHRIAQLEHNAKIAIRGGIAASVFVAVLFVVVEVVANQLSNNVGLGISGVIAGGMLFALHPLQRFAERVARGAEPAPKPLASMTKDERALMYLEQARIAWADGKLQRKERLLLDRLREQLGLSAREASRLEADALSGP